MVMAYMIGNMPSFYCLTLPNGSFYAFYCKFIKQRSCELKVCVKVCFSLESSVKQYSSNLKLYPISSHSEFSFLIKYLHFVLHIYRKARRTAEDNKTSMAAFFKLVSILNAPFQHKFLVYRTAYYFCPVLRSVCLSVFCQTLTLAITYEL